MLLLSLDETSLSEKMKAIDNMTIVIERVHRDTGKRVQENAKYKIRINRLNTEIQKLCGILK